MNLEGLSRPVQQELAALIKRQNDGQPGLTESSAVQVAARLEKEGIRADLGFVDNKDHSKGYTVKWAERGNVPAQGDRLGGQEKPTSHEL